MFAPPRRRMLKWEISREARRIAHAVTKTCRYPPATDRDVDHSRACNALKHEIEALVRRATRPVDVVT